jgi:hypothetical protein
VLAPAVDDLRVERIVAGFATVIEDLGETLQMLESATDFSLAPWRLASGM